MKLGPQTDLEVRCGMFRVQGKGLRADGLTLHWARVFAGW